MYEIRVKCTFEAGHAIRLPDGSMEPIHLHTWSVHVTVGNQALDRLDLVMDFHELEAMVGEMAARVEGQTLNHIEQFKTDGITPTAERVAWWFATELTGRLPEGVHVTAVEVEEAPGCIAVFRPTGRPAP